jgi:hypothetical protein
MMERARREDVGSSAGREARVENPKRVEVWSLARSRAQKGEEWRMDYGVIH